MSWKIWYDDGSTFTSSDGDPEEAPAWGVQVITQDDGNLKALVEGDDYYYFDERHGRWFGVELIGLVDYLVQTGQVKLGRFIPQEQYIEIVLKATAELQE